MPHTTNLLDNNNNNVPQRLQEWASAVNKSVPADIANFYSDQAMLKGTVWDGFVDRTARYDGARTVESYFCNLINGRENIHVRWNKIYELRPGVWAVDYSFVFNDSNSGQEHILNADATFILDDNLDKIILHHSSPARND